MKWITRTTTVSLAVSAASLAWMWFQGTDGVDAQTAGTDAKTELLAIAQARKLNTDDMVAAVSTYNTEEIKDEFVCLNSGGQAGSVIAYGVPSMRILKYIPTAAPDSAAGFHYDEESKAVAEQGFIDGRPVTWGDTHHPAFSETDGKYDGKYAFINDKANPRIFVMDLRDFETKQIVPSPIFRSNHGGAFVTPNTEYIIEASQYASPLDRQYRPMNQRNFDNHFRGGITYHKFDREIGRIDTAKSFTIEAPPYVQDLSDSGKGESAGWSFTNSLCSERYIGGIEQGRPPWEAGCSSADTDFLHVVNWEKAAKVAAAGRTVQVNGHNVIPLDVAIEEELLFLVPEAKSPHGVDVSPDGRFIVVAGKLDTHAQVFDIRKIKDLIAKKDYAGKDAYGLPILDHKKALHGQVQLGLGPLHTQYDAKEGVAFTSVYIDSVVVKWDYINLKVLSKQSVHYNIGHLVAMQGDSQDPRGKYVISLNKLAIDRFSPVGPLHPQNHQLIDVSGEKMRLLYDMPLPLGEPHYTACIDVNTLKPIQTYEPGTNSSTMQPSEFATTSGEERIERDGSKVRVFATVTGKGLVPSQVAVEQGDDVYFHVTNLENTPGAGVVFNVGGYNAMTHLAPGRTATVHVSASQAGVFNVQTHRTDLARPSRSFAQLSVKPVAAREQARKRQYLSSQVARKELHEWTLLQPRAELGPGEREFVQYGCSACHKQGREVGGPDLTDVNVRRDQAWLKKWIMAPDAMYDDPAVVAMIERFGVKMPNQGVTDADADAIIGYLGTWKSEAAKVSEAASPGEKAYGKVCFACHTAGVGGAPKLGDKAAWAPRIAAGEETLMKHVVEGFKGNAGFMPPRGGCGDCTDADLKASLDYILEKSR